MTKLNLSLLLLLMNKIKNLIFFLLFILLVGCSFDDKTGIWTGNKKEEERISELEKEQRKIIDVTKIYSSDDNYSKQISSDPRTLTP